MKAQAAIDMIREAYKRARSSRTPLHIVADASAGYRITPKVNPDDTVLFTDIVPPAWDDALETAKIKAFFEFSDAGPALQRVAEIAGKHPDAVDEIAEAVMRRYFDGIGGMWCVNAGYGRREIAEAMAEQCCAQAFASFWRVRPCTAWALPPREPCVSQARPPMCDVKRWKPPLW